MMKSLEELFGRFHWWQRGHSTPKIPRDEPQQRIDAVDAAGRAHLIRTIGHRIAIEAARETIISHASPRGGAVELTGALWDTQRTDPPDADMQFRVNRAATFLDLCGLLERVPNAPHIVRIKMEDFPL